MRKNIDLTLPYEMVVEILNNLYDGLEVWRDTEEYLASGTIVSPCVITKCSSVRKARRMTRLYHGAISTIEKLLKSK
ncbi:hypothetical protein ES705_29967 [subsurface metagenome]